MSKKMSKTKRGGFLGNLISQAIVPFTILGLQQTYKRKRSGGKSTRKYHKGGKSKRRH